MRNFFLGLFLAGTLYQTSAQSPVNQYFSLRPTSKPQPVEFNRLPICERADDLKIVRRHLPSEREINGILGGGKFSKSLSLPEFQRLAKQVLTVVSVNYEKGGEEYTPNYGSGVYLSSSGLVLTDWHLIVGDKNGKSSYCGLSIDSKGNAVMSPLEVLAYSKKHDLALMQAKTPPRSLSTIPMAYHVHTGQNAIFITREFPPQDKVSPFFSIIDAGEEKVAAPFNKFGILVRSTGDKKAISLGYDAPAHVFTFSHIGSVNERAGEGFKPNVFHVSADGDRFCCMVNLSTRIAHGHSGSPIFDFSSRLIGSVSTKEADVPNSGFVAHPAIIHKFLEEYFNASRD